MQMRGTLHLSYFSLFSFLNIFSLFLSFVFLGIQLYSPRAWGSTYMNGKLSHVYRVDRTSADDDALTAIEEKLRDSTGDDQLRDSRYVIPRDGLLSSHFVGVVYYPLIISLLYPPCCLLFLPKCLLNTFFSRCTCIPKIHLWLTLRIFRTAY